MQKRRSQLGRYCLNTQQRTKTTQRYHIILDNSFPIAVLWYFWGLFDDCSIFPDANQVKLLQIFGKIYRKQLFPPKIRPCLFTSPKKSGFRKSPCFVGEQIEQSRGLSDSVYSIHCTTSLAKLTSKNYNYVPPLILNVTFFFTLSKNTCQFIIQRFCLTGKWLIWYKQNWCSLCPHRTCPERKKLALSVAEWVA